MQSSHRAAPSASRQRKPVRRHGSSVKAKTLLKKLERKNPYAAGHSRRVGSYAKLIALELGLSKLRAAQMERYGVLHDMGKMLVPNALLDKPGKLNDRQWRKMQRHSDAGGALLARVLSRHPQNQLAILVAQLHHQRVDGKPAPNAKPATGKRKVKAQPLPLEARIVAVADVYDAMTSQRSYNVPKSKSEAIAVLRSIAGTQLDRQVVDAFIKVAKRLPEPNAR